MTRQEAEAQAAVTMDRWLTLARQKSRVEMAKAGMSADEIASAMANIVEPDLQDWRAAELGRLTDELAGAWVPAGSSIH